ncbi:hypothetical protein OC845_002312 [Tilletia horrida]|nr:hypothetical protein OC845_002312 [Tilletia horrida]
MTPPLTTSVVIDIVFIPIYLILAAITVWNFIRLRSVKFSFATTLIFAFVRLIGNILMVAAWKDNYHDHSLLQWGEILSIIGYGFLFSSTLAMYNGATELGKTAAMQRAGKLIHLLNTAATILIILGITNSNVFQTPPPADPSLDSKTHIGAALLVAETVGLAGLIFMAKIAGTANQNPWHRIMLNISMIALPFLAIKLGYTCYVLFGNHLINVNVWVRLIFASIDEIILVIIFNTAGLMLAKHFHEMVLTSSPGASDAELARPQQMMQQQGSAHYYPPPPTSQQQGSDYYYSAQKPYQS